MISSLSINPFLFSFSGYFSSHFHSGLVRGQRSVDRDFYLREKDVSLFETHCSLFSETYRTEFPEEALALSRAFWSSRMIHLFVRLDAFCRAVFGWKEGERHVVSSEDYARWFDVWRLHKRPFVPKTAPTYFILLVKINVVEKMRDDTWRRDAPSEKGRPNAQNRIGVRKTFGSDARSRIDVSTALEEVAESMAECCASLDACLRCKRGLMDDLACGMDPEKLATGLSSEEALSAQLLQQVCVRTSREKTLLKSAIETCVSTLSDDEARLLWKRVKHHCSKTMSGFVPARNLSHLKEKCSIHHAEEDGFREPLPPNDNGEDSDVENGSASGTGREALSPETEVEKKEGCQKVWQMDFKCSKKRSKTAHKRSETQWVVLDARLRDWSTFLWAIAAWIRETGKWQRENECYALLLCKKHRAVVRDVRGFSGTRTWKKDAVARLQKARRERYFYCVSTPEHAFGDVNRSFAADSFVNRWNVIHDLKRVYVVEAFGREPETTAWDLKRWHLLGLDALRTLFVSPTETVASDVTNAFSQISLKQPGLLKAFGLKFRANESLLPEFYDDLGIISPEWFSPFLTSHALFFACLFQCVVTDILYMHIHEAFAVSLVHPSAFVRSMSHNPNKEHPSLIHLPKPTDNASNFAKVGDRWFCHPVKPVFTMHPDFWKINADGFSGEKGPVENPKKRTGTKWRVKHLFSCLKVYANQLPNQCDEHTYRDVELMSWNLHMLRMQNFALLRHYFARRYTQEASRLRSALESNASDEKCARSVADVDVPFLLLYASAGEDSYVLKSNEDVALEEAFRTRFDGTVPSQRRSDDSGMGTYCDETEDSLPSFSATINELKWSTSGPCRDKRLYEVKKRNTTLFYRGREDFTEKRSVVANAKKGRYKDARDDDVAFYSNKYKGVSERDMSVRANVAHRWRSVLCHPRVSQRDYGTRRNRTDLPPIKSRSRDSAVQKMFQKTGFEKCCGRIFVVVM